MRLAWVVVLAACGEEFDAPDDCQPGQIHIVHGTADVTATLGNLSFVNVFGQNGVGTLDIGDIGGNGGGDRVFIEFPELLAHGDTVAARGLVKLAGIDAGNCDGDGFSGVLRQDDDGDGWRWSLGDLYAPPYCGGTKVAASLSGCYRTSN